MDSHIQFQFNEGKLRPYKHEPRRTVPDYIDKPDYATHPKGESKIEEKDREEKTIPVYSKEDIEGIRESCRIGRLVLDEAHKIIKAGITTEEIDDVVYNKTIELGGYPSPLNYYNFPKSVCT